MKVMPRDITQQYAKKQRPIAYQCKSLDTVSKIYPTCLKVMEASAKLVEATSNFALESL